MSPNRVKPDNVAQSKRFLQLAKELGADADEEALAASVGRLAARAPEPRRKTGKKTKAK